MYKLVYKSVSNLSVKYGIYYFVRRVPSDLVHHYKSTRISYSLRTRNPNVALSRSKSATHKLDEYWYYLRLQHADIPSLHLVVDHLVTSNDEELGPKLTQALDTYLNLKGPNKGITYHRAAQRACSYLIKACGDRKLLEYKRLDANAFRDSLLKRGLSGSSISRIFNSILSVTNFGASEYGISFVNPFSGVFYDRKAGVLERPPVPKENLERIKAKCLEIDDDLRWLIALLSDTGLRLAEGAGILTQDLHLDAEIPFLRLKDHPWRRLKTSGSARDVPLVGISLWAAKRIKNKQSKESFAFPRYNKGELTNANSASASLNKWLKPYVPYGCTLHSLRHSIRDRLRAVECPSDVVDQIGGWATGGVGNGYGNGYPLAVLSKWLGKTVEEPLVCTLA